jgi:hypothetical protein
MLSGMAKRASRRGPVTSRTAVSVWESGPKLGRCMRLATGRERQSCLTPLLLVVHHSNRTDHLMALPSGDCGHQGLFSFFLHCPLTTTSVERFSERVHLWVKYMADTVCFRGMEHGGRCIEQAGHKQHQARLPMIGDQSSWSEDLHGAYTWSMP